jgi:hypothetical protein
MDLKDMNSMVSVLEKARVPRIEDLPYWTSPPVMFVYQSRTPLVGGMFTWADAPSTLTPDRPILDNAVYYFRSITMVADVSELDYEGSLPQYLPASFIVPPEFRMFLASDANTVLFREPIVMTKYFQNFDYRFIWTASRGQNSSTVATASSPSGDNHLLAGFNGVLLQSAGLLGKTYVTLKAVISAQEIVDEEYTIPLRKSSYPRRTIA